MKPAISTVALITTLTGCFNAHEAPNSRLNSAWTFAPPRGWIARGNPRGPFGLPPIAGVQAWSRRDGEQIVSLHVMPAPPARALPSILDPYFTKYSLIRLCHGLPALMGTSRPPFNTSISDEVAMKQPGSIAVASYRYSRISAPDPAAEASIRSLCPARRAQAGSRISPAR